MEKSLLVMVWTISMAYSVITPQLVSDEACDVREDPLSTLGAVSVFMALFLPLILGPVSALLSFLLEIFFLYLLAVQEERLQLLLQCPLPGTAYCNVHDHL